MRSDWSVRHTPEPCHLRCGGASRTSVSSPVLGRWPESEQSSPGLIVHVPIPDQVITNNWLVYVTFRGTVIGSEADLTVGNTASSFHSDKPSRRTGSWRTSLTHTAISAGIRGLLGKVVQRNLCQKSLRTIVYRPIRPCSTVSVASAAV